MISVLLRLNVNDIQETCKKNAAAALTVGRRDVAKVPLNPHSSSPEGGAAFTKKSLYHRTVPAQLTSTLLAGFGFQLGRKSLFTASSLLY